MEIFVEKHVEIAKAVVVFAFLIPFSLATFYTLLYTLHVYYCLFRKYNRMQVQHYTKHVHLTHQTLLVFFLFYILDNNYTEAFSALATEMMMTRTSYDLLLLFS